MKKKLLSLLLLTTAQLGFSACIPAQDIEYQNLSLLLVAKNDNELNNLVYKYCFDTKKIGNRIPNIKTLSAVKIFEKYNENMFNTSINGVNQDMFSMFLYNSIYNNKTRDISAADKEIIVKLYHTRFPDDKRSLDNVRETASEKLKNQTEILDYLANKIKSRSMMHKDVFGNNSLAYVILTNSPQYFEESLGLTKNLNLSLVSRNKENYNNLYLMFNPRLKGKDVSKLNDKVISGITPIMTSFSRFNSITYFYFAELMKENNPDFFNKLKSKFKFNNKIVENKNVEYTRNKINEQLDYIKQLLSMN